MADEGTGTIVTFGSFSGKVERIAPFDAEVESIPTTHLGTIGGKTSMPATLPETSDAEMDVQFEQGVNLPELRAEGTLKVTFPDAGGSYWQRDAWVKKVSAPEAVVGTKLTTTIIFETHGAITKNY